MAAQTARVLASPPSFISSVNLPTVHSVQVIDEYVEQDYGLNDLKSLSQPEQFHDSMILSPDPCCPLSTDDISVCFYL